MIKSARLVAAAKSPWIGAFIATLALALGLRSVGLGKSIWLDESVTLKIISDGGLFARMRALDLQPPLYFILLKMWSYGGTSSAYLRLLPVVISIGTLLTMVFWLKPYSRLASVLAGLQFATLPIILRYSQELRAYPLLLFGTALSYLFAERVVELPEKPIYYWGLTIGLSLCVLTHMVGAMVVAGVLFFILARARFRIRSLNVMKLVIPLFLPALIFGYMYFFFIPSRPVLGDWWMPSLSPGLVIDSSISLATPEAISYSIKVLAARIGTLGEMLPWIVTALAVLCAGITLLAGNWRQTWPYLAAALFYELEIIICTALILPVLYPNTLLPMLIPGMAFVALQISTIRFDHLKTIAAAGLIGLCMAYAAYWIRVQARVPIEPWKEVAQYIEKKAAPDDMIMYFPPYSAVPTEYYLGGSAPAGRLLADFSSDANPLPFDDSHTIGAGDVGMLYAAVDKYTYGRPSPDLPYRLFLVARDGDSYVLQHEMLYEALVSSLAKKSGSAPIVKKFGPLSIRVYEVQGK